MYRREYVGTTYFLVRLFFLILIVFMVDFSLPLIVLIGLTILAFRTRKLPIFMLAVLLTVIIGGAAFPFYSEIKLEDSKIDKMTYAMQKYSEYSNKSSIEKAVNPVVCQQQINTEAVGTGAEDDSAFYDQINLNKVSRKILSKSNNMLDRVNNVDIEENPLRMIEGLFFFGITFWFTYGRLAIWHYAVWLVAILALDIYLTFVRRAWDR